MLTEVHQTEGANIARSDLHVELKSKQNSETLKMVTPSMQRVRGQRNIWPRMQTQVSDEQVLWRHGVRDYANRSALLRLMSAGTILIDALTVDIHSCQRTEATDILAILKILFILHFIYITFSTQRCACSKRQEESFKFTRSLVTDG